MMSVHQIKELIRSGYADLGWRIELRKWEHMSPTSDGKYQGYKGMPNVCGVRLIDKHDRVNDIDGRTIRQLVFEDDLDNEMVFGSIDECIDKLVDGLQDGDLVELRLQVEETKGHFDMIEMQMSCCDTSYSEMLMILDLEEITK